MVTLAAARDDRRVEAMERLKGDLRLFAAECLKIKPKDVMATPIVPLIMNRTQMHVHMAAEAQRAKHGWVRMMVGKGRKTTVSTYVAARGFHRAVFNRGVSVRIMAHTQDTVDELFDMVKRFHEHMPRRPITDLDNAKMLEFSKLDSEIAVTTAGSKGTGRGRTPLFLQWSEAAHSPNAHQHWAGIVQSVPGVQGSEIWVETTGAGPGGSYAEHWQDAERGIGDYLAIFAPWYWTEEYMRALPDGFTLDRDEIEYRALHDLTLEQMCWRRAKLVELKDDVLFMQEYPATSAEMFQHSDNRSYIAPDSVLRAQKTEKEGFGALVVGVDPARFGDDSFSVAWRRGRKVQKVQSREKIGTTEALAWLKDIIDQDKPDMMFLDAGGGGDRLWDILQSWGKPYSECTKIVNFAGKPMTEIIIERDGTKHPGPVNRRAEMWMRSREWLEQESGVDLPDQPRLMSDACGPRYTYRTTDQALQLESKESMRARGIPSPDEWDSIVLTFAEPVVQKRPVTPRPEQPLQLPSGPSSAWMGV